MINLSRVQILEQVEKIVDIKWLIKTNNPSYNYDRERELRLKVAELDDMLDKLFTISSKPGEELIEKISEVISIIEELDL